MKDHIALDFGLFVFLSSTSLCLYLEATGKRIFFATLGQRDGLTEEIHLNMWQVGLLSPLSVAQVSLIRFRPEILCVPRSAPLTHNDGLFLTPRLWDFASFHPFTPAVIFEFQSDCSLGRLLNSTPQLCHSQASASISSRVSLSLPESPTKPLHLWRPFWTTPSSLLSPQSFQLDPVNQDVTSVSTQHVSLWPGLHWVQSSYLHHPLKRGSS